MGVVVDPAGVRWRVRRRWYPWRRMLSVRGLLTSEPTEPSEPGEPTEPSEPGAPERTKPDMPANIVGKALFLLLGVVVWIVVGVAKLLFYTAVVLLFLIASLAEFALQLLLMPIALLLRLVGAARWPVEIGRRGAHFATQHADGFSAAGDLRDRLTGDITAGTPPPREPAPAA